MVPRNLQGSSLFSRTSAFIDDELGEFSPNFQNLDVVGVIPSQQQQEKLKTNKTTVEIAKKQIEDWVYRLRNAADEAGDDKLIALELDRLLD
jgi:hypothetical protein